MRGGDDHIPKGFILKARAIEDSEIAHAPPHVREVWDLILRKANFKDRQHNGVTIRRGQWLTRIPEIRELLHWTVGARKERYERYKIENAMKWLRTREMVATAKAARGLFITVVNFDRYQTMDSYECRNGCRDGSRSAAERKQRKSKNDSNPPPTPQGDGARAFDRFWEVWPRKQAKKRALKVWAKLNPDNDLVERILAAVESQKHCRQWQKDDGAFIPLPATWLNGEQWDDEIPPAHGDTSASPAPIRDAKGRTPRDRLLAGSRT